MQNKSKRKRSPGHLNVLFANNTYADESIENILRADIQGKDFEKHEVGIPMDELDSSFTETYKYMAQEFGNNVPGSIRGLKQGDWLLIETLPDRKGNRTNLRCLIASWRYKLALEKYCAMIAWTEDMENALYILKRGYPHTDAKL